MTLELLGVSFLALTPGWMPYLSRMPHVFETAPTGRARCRGCNQTIQRGDLRFGERLPNPFGEGEMTLWFHPLCAAFKRPEPLLETIAQAPETPPDRDRLERVAQGSMAQRRLPRVSGAERAPSGQAKCRSCHEPIERGTWRIRLVFFEQGRFTSGGFVHLACRTTHFEDHDILDALLHFSPDLDDDARKDLERAYREVPPSPAPAQPRDD